MFEILYPNIGEPMCGMLKVEIIVLGSEMPLGLWKEPLQWPTPSDLVTIWGNRNQSTGDITVMTEDGWFSNFKFGFWGHDENTEVSSFSLGNWHLGF